MSLLDNVAILKLALIAGVPLVLSFWFVRHYDQKFSYRWLNAVGAVAFIVWRSYAMDTSPEAWTITGSRIFAATMMAIWVGGVELGALLARP